MSTIKVDTVRPVTTDASLTLQGDSSGSGVTGITIDSSGNATLNGTANNLGTVSAGTLGSGVVFPAGYVLRSFYDEVITTFTTITTSGGLYSDLELSISSPSTSNYLIVNYCIPDVYNLASANNRLGVQVVYSTDNWTSNSQFGSNAYVQKSTGQVTVGTGVLQNHCGTIRALHPTSSDYKVRLFLVAFSGSVNIFHSSDCVGTLTGYEVKG